jgi:hypothetical protein
MVRKLVLLVISMSTVASSAWAYRIIEQPEDAYELSLGYVQLPADERGTVIFTACDGCRTTTLRVTEATQYFANRVAIELDDLHELADDLRATADGRENTDVYVYYDVASLRVNRLALSYRN